MFIKSIPDKYLLRRWQRNIIRPEELKKKYSLIERGVGCGKDVQDLYAVMAECVGLVAHDPQAMSEYLEWMKEKRNILKTKHQMQDVGTTKELVESFVGVSIPSSTDIRNPENVRNKGCGSSKRLKGQREIAMNNAIAEARHCTYCNKKILPNEKHDRRNCPLRKQHDREKEQKNNKSWKQQVFLIKNEVCRKCYF